MPGMAPVANKKHEEQDHDHGIRPDRDPKTMQFGLPRRTIVCHHFSSVGASHFVRISHEKRNDHANESQD